MRQGRAAVIGERSEQGIEQSRIGTSLVAGLRGELAADAVVTVIAQGSDQVTTKRSDGRGNLIRGQAIGIVGVARAVHEVSGDDRVDEVVSERENPKFNLEGLSIKRNQDQADDTAAIAKFIAIAIGFVIGDGGVGQIDDVVAVRENAATITAGAVAADRRVGNIESRRLAVTDINAARFAFADVIADRALHDVDRGGALNIETASAFADYAYIDAQSSIAV